MDACVKYAVTAVGSATHGGKAGGFFPFLKRQCEHSQREP